MTLIKKLAIYLTMTFMVSIAQAEPATHEPFQDSDKKQEKLISKLKQEAILLKSQNKLIQDYQSSLISTVYWALGIVATIFTLLMGFSFFTNFKFYEKDKTQLKLDLNSLIEIFKSELLTEFERNKNEIEKTFEAKNEDHIKILLNQNSEIRSHIENIRAELLGEVKSIKTSHSKFAEKYRDLEKSILKSEADFRAIEEMVWELKDNPECILVTQSQGVDAAVAAENKYALQSVLKRMNETLTEHFLEKDIKPDNEMFELLDETMSTAQKLEPQLVKTIRLKIRKCGEIEEQ
jgi:hypothetical protein